MTQITTHQQPRKRAITTVYAATRTLIRYNYPIDDFHWLDLSVGHASIQPGEKSREFSIANIFQSLDEANDFVKDLTESWRGQLAPRAEEGLSYFIAIYPDRRQRLEIRAREDDAAPDIYETPELTDDASTIPAPSTLRSDSRASSTSHPDGDDSAIDRHRIDPNEARNSFLGNDTKDSASHGWIGSKRAAYRTSSRRVHNGILEEGSIDSSDDDDEESLERKLARLRREVAEVKESFQKRRNEAEAKQRPPVIKVEAEQAKKELEPIETLDSLSRVLENIEKPGGPEQDGSARRLVRNLEEAYQPNEPGAPNISRQTFNEKKQSGNSMDQPLNYDQSHTLSRVSDFDKRLRLLEAALGMDLIPLPTQDRSASRAILPVLDSLDRQISTLSVTDPSLDKISRQIRHLTEDAEKLAEARKAAAAQLPSNQSSRERKRMSATKTGGRAIEDKEDVDQTSKINALYGTLPTIESLSPLLPSVLDRLRSLRRIHADAANASDSLSKMESRQAAMVEELKEWTEGLEKVESAMQHGEISMKENLHVIEHWVKELESRMHKLGASHGV
ncbi:MAG: hypothetical protein Q9166_001649 [cf. Caloplaca sp. 2 TL-2023]